jgi:hypothetical protein
MNQSSFPQLEKSLLLLGALLLLVAVVVRVLAVEGSGCALIAGDACTYRTDLFGVCQGASTDVDTRHHALFKFQTRHHFQLS